MDMLDRAKVAVPLLMLVMMLVSVPAFAQMDFSGTWTPNG